MYSGKDVFPGERDRFTVHKPIFAAMLTASIVVAAGSAALADSVTLRSGETLVGQVVEQTEAHVIVEHPVLGKLTIAAADIQAVAVDAAAADQVPAEAEAAVAPAPAPAAPVPAPAAEPKELIESEPSFFEGWDASLGLGFSGTEGNSETSSLNAEFKAQREDEEDRWIFRSAYFTGSSDGETNKNEFLSELTKDWLQPDSPWLYFAQGKYQYDQFQSWKHRVSGFGGMGYKFIKRDDLEIIGRLGLGLTKELEGERNLTPEALVGASLVKWKLTDNQTISAGATIYPALDELGEYRAIGNVEWKIKIDEADGLSLKFGLENEYESDVDTGTKHNDLKYYGALVFDF